MNLSGALRVIGRATGLSSAKLLRYAHEFDGDNERKVLYALVRVLKPSVCLEIGTSHGDGTMCIASALQKNDQENEWGVVITVDINPDIGQHFLPDLAEEYVRVVNQDANVYVENNGAFDFIFEDGNHSIHQVQTVYTHLDHLLSPGGIIVSHDAAMDGVGAYIREGQLKAGYDLPVYVIDPLPWGYTVYRKREANS